MRARGVVVGLGQPPPPSDDIVDLGPVAVVDGSLPEELRLEVVVRGGWRVVPELGVLDDDVAHVDPEAGHTPVEPEPEDRVESGPDLLVPPIEIRLLGRDDCAGSTDRCAGPASRPDRRSCSPSCWGPSRRPSDPPRRTSRAGWRCVRSGSRRTTGAGRSCGSERCPRGRGCPGRRPRRRGGRTSPSFRDRGARRSSRPRRSPSRRWAKR